MSFAIVQKFLHTKKAKGAPSDFSNSDGFNPDTTEVIVRTPNCQRLIHGARDERDMPRAGSVKRRKEEKIPHKIN